MLRHAALVLAAAVFIAAVAQVSVSLHIGPVPITGLTFGVLLSGALLGPRLGLSAALTYLAMGVVGLPVYAEGSHGWAVLTGSTGGFLIGTPFVALLVGWLAERGWDRRPATLAAALLLGNVVIYAFGLPWLWAWGGRHEALLGIDDMTLGLTLKWGLVPFIPGDLAKLLLAAGLVPSGWQLLRAVRLGPARVLSGTAEAPRRAQLGLVAMGAGLAMAAGAMLAWAGESDLGDGAAAVVAGMGAAGAVGALLRKRGSLGAGLTMLVGFMAAGTGGLVAFVHLVRFTAAGTLELADAGVGLAVAVVAAVVLFATTAWETPAE
ncbi:MAG TPA: biotin transporter BioY [Dehalococcoidia bacterium]|nr:biotin transporter BioY [Dehalococcoidia bacterium]